MIHADLPDPTSGRDPIVTVGGPHGVKTVPAHAIKHVSNAWRSASAIFKQTTLGLTVLTIVATLGLAGYGIHVAFQSSSSATLPDPANFNSPYGFTLRNTAVGASNGIDTELLSEYKDLGVHWVRDQMKWSWAETSKGVYNWTQLDQQVQMANSNGLHIVYVIQAAPSWWQITCPVDGAKYEFSPEGVTAFATALATRYNGKNGHGYIDAFEIGNEDFDQHYTGSISTTEQCRSAKTFVPVLEAGYKAIKAQSPTALVGMFGMWWESIKHENTFLNDMYTIDPNVGRYFDYGNFHYYNNLAPDQSPSADYPTFNQRWQIMHSIFSAHGDGSKPIWVTETGWDSSNPTLQNQAMQYVMDQSRKSGVIQKVFWYTINWDATKDIQPGDRNTPPTFKPLPAYNTLKQYIQQYPTWGGGSPPPPPPPPSSSPTFSHVFIIMEENKSFSQVIGSSSAPYVNSLAKKYGVAANYHEVGSPSEPNYLGLTGGSNFGHTSDCLVNSCPVNAPNIADELENAGLSWKAYMESMPAPCSTSDTSLYAQKHNPFVYYNDIRTNTSRCQSHDVPYTQFASDLSSGNVPDYVFITPNMCNDGHNGPSACGGSSEVANEDAWLSKNVPQILNSSAWKNNGLLVIMWDEQEGTSTIPNVIISPLSKPGFTSNTSESHYSLLRTIEDNWKLQPLGQTVNAAAMTEYFTGTTPPPPQSPTVSLVATPTSVTSGGSSNLTWSSSDVTSCAASGAWSGSKPLSGSASTGPLTASATYNLSCTGPDGDASASATVTVGTPPPPPPSGSITLDTTSHATSGNNNVGSLAWNHSTGNHANSVLVVSAAMDEPSTLKYTVGSVTYGGKAMQHLATKAAPGGGCWCSVEMWYLVSPPAGSHQVNLKINGGDHQVVASAVTYYNVSLASPFAKPVVDKGYVSGNSFGSVTVPSKSSQVVVDAWATNSSQSFVPSPLQSLLWGSGAVNPGGFSSGMKGGASNGTSSTPIWKNTSQNGQPLNFVSIGVALNGS